MVKIIEEISTKEGLTKCLDKAVKEVMQFSFHDAEPFDEYAVDCIATYFKLMLNYKNGNLTEKEMQAGLMNLEPVYLQRLAGIFTSVWDDGTEIVTPCTYNRETGEVTAEVAETLPGKGAELEEEYIDVVLDGKSVRKEVCKECHGYVMQSIMREHCGHTEYKMECPACDSPVE